MFKNYVRIAIRQFWKNKNFSVINILGLALGMSCSLLIFLWVQDEKSVDAFHKNGNRLYRVYERNFADGKVSGGYYTPGPLAEELKRLVPEIEMSSAYLWPEQHTFSVDDKILKQNGNGADSDFFKMFSYPLLEGRPETALSGPGSIALSHSMATSFFGNPHNAMGKTIRFENKKDYQVTAVFEDLPANVSEHFDFLLNWKAVLEEYNWASSWDDNDPFTYVLLRSNANPDLVEKKIMNLLGQHEEYRDKAFRSELHLQRFGDSYLHGNFSNGIIDGGRIEYIRIFSLIAIFILLIACINFMNLTTARSLKRAREVGIRKVMGAVRRSLMLQFIGEAIAVSFLSAFVALLIVWLTLPSFNLLTEKQITLPFANSSFWIILTLLCFITGLISGSYPSLLLSSFNPIRVLKANAVKLNTGSLLFRKGLVIFQFTLSIILIISTIFISRQVRYVQQTNLGYDRDNLIYIPLEGELSKNFDLFKSEAQRLPGITSVSAVNLSPTNLQNGTMGIDWPGKDPNSKPTFAQIAVNYDFIKTMKLQMARGRDFSKDFATDSVGYIINEAAAATIGYKDPLGKPLTFWGKSGHIIGVVRDFHFQSFHQSIRPLIVRLLDPGSSGTLIVRVRAGQTSAMLASLEQLSKKLNPKFPFTFQFASDEYAKLYRNDQLVGSLSVIFSLLAIIISCLGLLGLAMFVAEQRTKEIGVRKVLGANIISLISLLSADFLMLIGISFLIAVPISVWAMHEWLSNFAYHITLSWWIFGAAGLVAILISLMTVSFHTIKAALANPIKALRAE